MKPDTTASQSMSEGVTAGRKALPVNRKARTDLYLLNGLVLVALSALQPWPMSLFMRITTIVCMAVLTLALFLNLVTVRVSFGMSDE